MEEINRKTVHESESNTQDILIQQSKNGTLQFENLPI